MSKTLGGIFWVKDGILYDYCFKESLESLQELCDKVVVIDCGSTDGTLEILQKYEDQNTIIVSLGIDEWNKQVGKEKIAYFQNLALSFLDTDYYYLQQADEITHEDCFVEISKAIETDREAFYCTRINLWGDCNSYINVESKRQPCSTTVIRLAKTDYRSVGDGESIEAMADISFIDKIRIYHYGFVRKKDVMKYKVINMQENVFQLGFHDPKLDESETFNSELWFKGNELSSITENHPKFIKDWVKSRP